MVAEIVTKKGERILIDDEDYALVGAHRWYISPFGYAVRNTVLADGNKRIEYMHRKILGATHKDGVVIFGSNS